MNLSLVIIASSRDTKTHEKLTVSAAFRLSLHPMLGEGWDGGRYPSLHGKEGAGWL